MFDKHALVLELTFKAIRSSGAGGQHVNKVSSKIELTYNINESLVFNDEQKERLLKKLKTKFSNEGVLIMQCDETRSQHKNKEIVTKRFFELLESGLFIPKKRIPTKTPKSAVKKRLKKKQNLSEKKANRQKPDLE
jgi:ribosome-associated protein